MSVYKIKSLAWSLFAVAALGLSACKDFFGDVNVDPNAANSATPSTLLPVIQSRIAYTFGGDFSRYGSIFTQHAKGSDRQFAAYELYSFVPDDFSTAWDNVYAGVLMDIKQLKIVSDANGYNYYGGIARALEAYTLMLATDFWGDLPYTNALDPDKTLQPAYDSQEAIYNTIFTLLNDARTKLAGAAGGRKPAGDDLIFAGTAAKWTKFCNALAARAYLHLGKVDVANYGKAITELNKGGLAAAADDAKFSFLSDETGAAPWYQYLSQRGDVSLNPKYGGYMTTWNDPRKAMYGAPLADPHPFFVINQKLTLLGFAEQKFIEAECKFRTNDVVGATAAYSAGIAASMAEAGATDAAAIATYVARTEVAAAPLSLDKIMTQKYIALFTNPEVFNDWRRTGIPALTPNSGTQVPRRFLYPQTERDLNTNSPKGLTLYSKVWWDK